MFETAGNWLRRPAKDSSQFQSNSTGLSRPAKDSSQFQSNSTRCAYRNRNPRLLNDLKYTARSLSESRFSLAPLESPNFSCLVRSRTFLGDRQMGLSSGPRPMNNLMWTRCLVYPVITPIFSTSLSSSPSRRNGCTLLVTTT